MIHVFASIQSRTFTSFEELTAAYKSGELHPGDLKPALAKSLNKILEVMIVLDLVVVVEVKVVHLGLLPQLLLEVVKRV